MALVNAKCTDCGGILEANDGSGTMVCPYCKAAFIVEDAIQNYNLQVKNEIKANVVNVYGDTNKDFTVVAGILKEYKGEGTEVVIPENVAEIGDCAFA